MSEIKQVKLCNDELPGGDWNENVLSEVGFIKEGKELYIAVCSLNEFSNIFVSDKSVYESLLTVLKDGDPEMCGRLYEEIKSGCSEYYETEDDEYKGFWHSTNRKEIMKALQINKVFTGNRRLDEETILSEINQK